MPYATLVLGVPGGGKSHLAASATEVVETGYLFATEPKEVEANPYRVFPGWDRDAYFDARWLPTLKKFEAGAYLRFVEKAWSLYDDTKYGAVSIDDLDGLAEIIRHNLLQPLNTDLDGIGDTRAYYGNLKTKLQEAVQLIKGLSTTAAKRPKYVFVIGHTQPARDEIVEKDPVTRSRVAKQSADQKAQGIAFEGNVLPALDGGFKYTIGGEFLNVIYTALDWQPPVKDGKIVGKKKVLVRQLQLVPDEERHAKVACGVPKSERCGNTFKEFLGAVI